MTIEADIIAHGAAPQLMARHAVNFSEDVPESNVDAANRRPSHDAIAMPKVLPVHHLPQVFDPRRILSNQELRNILYRANNAARMPLQRRLSPAPQSGLIGENFHKDP